MAEGKREVEGETNPEKERKKKTQRKKGRKKENPTDGNNMSSETTGWTAFFPH